MPRQNRQNGKLPGGGGYREPTEVATPKIVMPQDEASIRAATNQFAKFGEHWAKEAAEGKPIPPEVLRIMDIGERWTKQRRAQVYPQKIDLTHSGGEKPMEIALAEQTGVDAVKTAIKRVKR